MHGAGANFGTGCDPVKWFAKHKKSQDTEVVDFLLDVFLQGDVPATAREKLLDYCKQSRKSRPPKFWSETDAEEHRLRSLAHLTLLLPEFQLD